jgi:hypothetical protein
LQEFPESLCHENLKTHLSEIHSQRNKINNIPITINRLAALKVLDLSENCVTIVPGELGECSKLKDVNLKGNKLSDRRLLKLVDQNKAKQIMDYIKAHCPKTVVEKKKSEPVVGQDGKDGSSRRAASESSEEEEALDTLRVVPVKGDNWFLVTATAMVLEQRKIVCCIVRGVDLQREGNLKRYLALQTGLHEGICSRRQFATIAVHDLSKIQDKVVFDVKPPSKLKFVPLHRTKEMSASELYKQLNEEAEALRKEKKRNTYSGVHKYLYLLKGKQRYPCLYDASGTIISFPPITNSETTKMTPETTDLFLEVTGEKITICKQVMDALLHGMLKQGLGGRLKSGADSSPALLEVEPVRVVDPEGKLYVVYPSKVDLVYENKDIAVVRD